jgi:hypothetical protein
MEGPLSNVKEYSKNPLLSTTGAFSPEQIEFLSTSAEEEVCGGNNIWGPVDRYRPSGS